MKETFFLRCASLVNCRHASSLLPCLTNEIVSLVVSWILQYDYCTLSRVRALSVSNAVFHFWSCVQQQHQYYCRASRVLHESTVCVAGDTRTQAGRHDLTARAGCNRAVPRTASPSLLTRESLCVTRSLLCSSAAFGCGSTKKKRNARPGKKQSGSTFDEKERLLALGLPVIVLCFFVVSRRAKKSPSAPALISIS